MRPTSARRLKAAQNRSEALELKIAGASNRSIATALGVSEGMVRKYLDTSVRDFMAKDEPKRETYRAIAVQRLDRLLVGLWNKAAGGDYDAVDRALKIEARRAALLGLDAPRKIEATAAVDANITPGAAGPGEIDPRLLTPDERLELRKLVTSAQQRAAQGAALRAAGKEAGVPLVAGATVVVAAADAAEEDDDDQETDGAVPASTLDRAPPPPEEPPVSAPGGQGGPAPGSDGSG